MTTLSCALGGCKESFRLSRVDVGRVDEVVAPVEVGMDDADRRHRSQLVVAEVHCPGTAATRGQTGEIPQTL
jgi:hypothetical protein